MGSLLAVLGLVVLVLALLVFTLSLTPWVLASAVPLVLVGVVVGAVLLGRPSYVVRADEQGYQVRFVRGVGVAAARWADVDDVVATHVGGARCVVLRLRDGRTTTIPVDMLATPGDDFVRALQRHLDEGHGYRRVG